jgi:hypothetical protein
MANHLVLYSTNTRLACIINRRYYRDEHYVWCSPYFKVEAIPRFAATAPPTAMPGTIYERLVQDVRAGDKHSPFVDQNKIGIRRGAAAKRRDGVISDAQRDEILQVVDIAEIQEFKPVIYVIPYDQIAGMVAEIPVSSRAHPLSVEYLIERLPGRLFDIIELE